MFMRIPYYIGIAAILGVALANSAFANDRGVVNPSCKPEPENQCAFGELRKANLAGKDLHSGNYDTARMDKANLSNANLAEANLSGATLTKASLRGANLSGANLSKASLQGVDLSRATWINGRVCAKGSIGGCK